MRMSYEDWRDTFALFQYDDNRHSRQNNFYGNLLLETFANEFKNFAEIEVDEKFIEIVKTQVKACRNTGNAYDHQNAIQAMQSDPYQVKAYADFVKAVKENKYLQPPVVLYRTSENRIGVEFRDVKSKLLLEILLGKEKFIRNPHLINQVSPMLNSHNPHILEFHAYEASYGELTAVFPSQTMRDNFKTFLNLSNFLEPYKDEGQETSLYFKDRELKQIGTQLALQPSSKLLFTMENFLGCLITKELFRTLNNGKLINVLINIVAEYAQPLEEERAKSISILMKNGDASELLSSIGYLSENPSLKDKNNEKTSGNDANKPNECVIQ